MDTAKEILIVLGRIITIYPLLLMVTIYMGKRAIGELPIFDFLIILSLGSIVGADIADPDIKHIHTAVAIIALGIFQRIVAKWKMSNRKLGRLITFEPTIVVKDGKILANNLKNIHYSVDNILQMLRQKDVFDLKDVEIAIIEANGSISVYKKHANQNLTKGDLGISDSHSGIALPVMMEGNIYHDVLKQFHVNQTWLTQQLRMKQIYDTNEVLFASINHNLELHVSLRHEKNMIVPKLYH
ncbi:DUF421 domain-containing protein [Aquibacillus koreensis]|uniref:DUF421 domain-containing protein n=1 Tax=Aquibacillus koreensis TaxID=279446 RepID=A0A9X3WLX9_9BACI|nr:DUF421 domain-containing protein [Aquibacillus koreensis]MCT2537766.1 DUF421 domain-containing protein [Aquibacillus koreensis]MDC3421200.1 DUF421 domain-containing protein [Aquibacillus koreensis]